MTHPTRSPVNHRLGFTLMEVVVVSALMSLLLMLFSAAWRGFAQPTSTTIRRARMIREAGLLVEALSRDIGGTLTEQPLGSKESGRLVGHTVQADNELQLCFDGDPIDETANWSLPDTVITWTLIDDRVVRTNWRTGAAITVVNSVESFTVVDLGGSVRILVQFSDGNLTRDLTLELVVP
jgi:prepilin-type N-terminal cleavage/methylation domain-containing protein